MLTLPAASMFEAEAVSGVWIEVVERTSKFLKTVVLGEISGDLGLRMVPSGDRHTALKLLLEFAIQKGSLHDMLDAVMLLIHIWNSARRKATRHEQEDDNRSSGSVPSSSGSTSAPLVPFLKRIEAIEAAPSASGLDSDGEIRWSPVR